MQDLPRDPHLYDLLEAFGREPPPPPPPETLAVDTRDGVTLAVDLHTPVGAPPRAVAIVAPAMGVRRRFYRPFAGFLAGAGIAALVPDYRGIGDSAPRSLRGWSAALHDWGDLDLPAVVDAARARFPGVPLVWIGHSIGGQLFGLLPEAPIARALLVGAQNGHWRNWPGVARRAAMAALWWAVIPGMTALAGKLPMAAFGQGEDLPVGVAREWARWGRTRDYIAGFARRRGPSGFDRFTGPVRSYAITDDGYAPPPSVHALAADFRTARTEVVEVAPAAIGKRRLGHFGAFRPSAQALWAEWADWLLDAPAPASA